MDLALRATRDSQKPKPVRVRVKPVKVRKKKRRRFDHRYKFDRKQWSFSPVNALMSFLAYNRALDRPGCYPIECNNDTETSFMKALGYFKNAKRSQLYHVIEYRETESGPRGFKGNKFNKLSIGAIVVHFNNLLMIFDRTKDGTLYEQITKQLSLVEDYFNPDVFHRLKTKFSERKDTVSTNQSSSKRAPQQEAASRYSYAMLELESKLQARENQLQACKNQLQACENQLQARENQLQTCENEVQRFRREAEHYHKEARRLYEEVQRINGDLQNSRIQAEDFQKQVNTLRHENDRAKWISIRNDSLEKNNRELERNLKAWEAWSRSRRNFSARRAQ